METRTYTLKDISLNICDGVHNTVIDDENGDCLLLSAKNIQGGRIVFDENTDRKINRELCNKLKKRTKLSKNDIAITTVGANVGDLAIVGDGSENYEFQRSVGIIKANTKIADPIFLFYLLGTNSFNYYFHVNSYTYFCSIYSYFINTKESSNKVTEDEVRAQFDGFEFLEF